jgi:dTMP kinase
MVYYVMIIAIEGIDGAGKHTASIALRDLFAFHGFSSTVIGFPQYENTYAGRALGDFLAGTFSPPDVRVVAGLYALDRFEALAQIEHALAKHDVLIFDRYIGSNLAFQSAKAQPSDVNEILDWITSLELEVYKLPAPTLNVLLSIPIDEARESVTRKPEREYTKQVFDAHESDNKLQDAAQRQYRSLSKRTNIGPWLTIETFNKTGTRRTPDEIAEMIYDRFRDMASRMNWRAATSSR